MRSLTMWRLSKLSKLKLSSNKGKSKWSISDSGGEYYGRYDEIGHNPGPFVKYFQECGINAQYIMPCTPQHNGIAKRRESHASRYGVMHDY